MWKHRKTLHQYSYTIIILLCLHENRASVSLTVTERKAPHIDVTWSSNHNTCLLAWCVRMVHIHVYNQKRKS